MSAVELQQAFDFVLEEIQRGSPTVTESSRDVGYKKPYDMVRVPELSPAALRLLNAVNFIACRDPEIPTFDVDLPKIKWLASISTRDHQWIDGLAKELQQAAIEVLNPEGKNKDKEDWVRMPLLGPAGVKSGRFVFELNSVHRSLLKSPNRYAFFSLTKGHKLKGEHAPVLHDRLLMEVWRGETAWIPIPEFLGWFGKDKHDYYKTEGFRAIRVVIIEPSLKQINEHADFAATWEVQSHGRKVIAIRFILTRRAPRATEHELSEVRSQLYDVLRTEFNLSTVDFDEITAKSDVWTEARITEVIELTRYRIEFGKTEVGSPRSLFLHLLRNNAVFTAAERAKVAKVRDAGAKKALTAKVLEENRAAADASFSEIDRLLGRFAALSPEQQGVLLERFRESPSFALARSFLKKLGVQTLTGDVLLEDARLRGVFGSYLQTALDSEGFSLKS